MRKKFNLLSPPSVSKECRKNFKMFTDTEIALFSQKAGVDYVHFFIRLYILLRYRSCPWHLPSNLSLCENKNLFIPCKYLLFCISLKHFFYIYYKPRKILFVADSLLFYFSHKRFKRYFWSFISRYMLSFYFKSIFWFSFLAYILIHLQTQ